MFNLMIIAGNATVQKLSDFIDKYINTPLKIIAVVIFFVMTTIEYAKVVFSGDGSSKKANEKTLKKICGFINFILSTRYNKINIKNCRSMIKYKRIINLILFFGGIYESSWNILRL